MPTLQLGKEALLSVPFKVRFAGFESDTFSLGKNGWELSMQQFESPSAAAFQMRLAMRLESAGLYAISHPLHIDYQQVVRSVHEPSFMMQLVSKLGFDVMHVGSDFRFKIFPERHLSAKSFKDSFLPVDVSPQSEEVSIRDFKFFKVFNPELKDIILLPEQLPEVLNMVLKTQSQAQDEIRKREQSRRNLSRFKEGEVIGSVSNVKPMHSVAAQIITLAS